MNKLEHYKLDAYQQLKVGKEADDAAVKKAYLKATRENSPETHPEAFERIREAYELIKTKRHRIKYALFHHPAIDFPKLVGSLLPERVSQKPIVESLQAIIADSLRKGPHGSQ